MWSSVQTPFDVPMLLLTSLPQNLAPRPGLEPGTCGLTVRRSTG